jgi:hypothetical protein
LVVFQELVLVQLRHLLLELVRPFRRLHLALEPVHQLGLLA